MFLKIDVIVSEFCCTVVLLMDCIGSVIII